jgi:hypothetical protein
MACAHTEATLFAPAGNGADTGEAGIDRADVPVRQTATGSGPITIIRSCEDRWRVGCR